MRIDDFNFESHLEQQRYNETQMESNMHDIDQLINEIKISEMSLRKRPNKNGNKNTYYYISSPDLNDIDDVVINIDVPPEYYTNKERRIMKYDFKYIYFNLFASLQYLLEFTVKVITFILNSKKFKKV